MLQTLNLQHHWKVNSFTCIFQRFRLFFRNTYYKEHLSMTASDLPSNFFQNSFVQNVRRIYKIPSQPATDLPPFSEDFVQHFSRDLVKRNFFSLSERLVQLIVEQLDIFDNYYIHRKTLNMITILTVCSYMSRTHFKVNPHSIFAWMSRNSLLEIDVQISAHNSAQSFGQFGQKVECSFTS